MTRLSLFICFFLLIPAISFGNEWLREKKEINLGCNCQLESSSILKRLVGSCGGDEFTLTQQGIEELYKNRTVYVISSWQDYSKFKQKFFKSPYFETISEDFFNKNQLGVLYVTYTGSTFIKNEQIQKLNQECSFSYEIWDKTMLAIPACIWSYLYVLKLPK